VETVTIFLTAELGEALDAFEHEGTRFVFARLGADGPDRLAEGAVWVFVDWVLPTMAGLEMCRRLRADPRMQDAHVTMVLESGDAEDCRRALQAGADDYLTGPLDRRSVLDRVLALRSPLEQRHLAKVLDLGPLTIDMGSLQARWAGKPVSLRPNEFRLLRFLAENPDRVLTRQALIAGLGKDGDPIDERTVDVWVGRLRRALEAAGAEPPLRTVRSVGYVYDSV
jgi:two-component system, OmpR family, phosphate regulon response regulator PhoB